MCERVLGNIKNSLKVTVENGVAKLPDQTSFAGSVATADRLERTMFLIAGVHYQMHKNGNSHTCPFLRLSDKKAEFVIGKMRIL